MSRGGAGPLDRTGLEALAQKSLSLSGATDARVTIVSSLRTNTRFAANQLSTAGSVTDTSVTVRSAFDAKHATVQTNDLSDDGLRSAIAECDALAKLAPDDPEAMPPLGSQQYLPVEAYFENTAQVSAADRAKAALTALGPARAASSVTAAGFIVTGAVSTLIANKAGLSAFHRSTSANYTLTVRTADGSGSGWAGADNPDWSAIDFDGVARSALDKAQRARNPVALEPGRYTVVFEPQATGDLVQLIGRYVDARRADEGRSPFSKAGGGNKVGDRIMDPRVTIVSDPSDAHLRSDPFDSEGYPLARQVWVNDGVVTQLSYTRFWAKKQAKPYTGLPHSFMLMGGPTSRDDLIKGTERGVLVTRLWYLREVDPRTILYTGLTRDGTFLIEYGAIIRPVKNFRFNDSPLVLLNNLEGLGPAERLAGTEAGGDVVMPPLRAHDFNFTSLSDAV